MVRTYKRKTTRAGTAPDTMLKAVRQVLVFKKTIRGAAEEFGINYRTLARYCSKIPREEVEGGAERPSCSVGFVGARQVFSASLEAQLLSYVLLASEVYHTLPPKAVRRLSFHLAEAQRVPMPPSWSQNKQASADWFAAFMKRHPLVSAGAFSKSPVEAFYSKLQTLMERHCFRPEDMWVMDETGIATAPRPDRVVSRRGPKHTGPSVERGPLVSVACAVSAAGDTLPPYFVFPRVQFREHFLTGAPAGSSGGAHLSGWMREEQFVHFLEHFLRHTQGSRERRRLLLLDGQTLHLSIEALDALKAGAVVALSVPPQLQPLEDAVFGPMKKSIGAAIDSWTLAGPGRSVTIHHIPAIVATALPLAASRDSIAHGFRACGIFPLDPSASIQPGPASDCPATSDSNCGAPERPHAENNTLKDNGQPDWLS